MSISNKRVHLHNAIMEKLFSFSNSEKLDLKSSDHDTENIYEPEKNQLSRC